MPAAFKALLAQAAGWALAVLLLSTGILASQAWALALTQCIAAAAVAFMLRSEPWWLAIHLGFAPLLLLAQGLGIARGWYLVAFLALVTVYWTSFRTRVPLYLSNSATALAVAAQLPADRPVEVLDLGSGTGSMLIPLAQKRPDCRFLGIEAAPAPFLVSWLRSRGRSNVHFRRGDFFACSWAGYDLVYAFLSPVPMERVWAKARAELSPGAQLISNSFPVPGRKPDSVVDVQDARGTRLFVYNQRSSEKDGN